MMYTNEHANQFKKELKTLIHAERIHPKVMNVALKAVYGELMPPGFHTLGELVTAYMEASHSTWDAKKRESSKSVLELLLKYVGPETDIKSIGHYTLLAFRNDVLMKIPARWRVFPELREAPLAELVKDHGRPQLSAETVNHFCTLLRKFFSWCATHQYIEKSPAKDIRLTVSKFATGNISYSSEELEKMFHHLSPECLLNWKPYKLFIPALALYNGLRMSEACQLQFENIVQVDGIPCIRVEDNEEIGATVKNLSCIRTIPIHPVILQLGFLEFVGKIKNGPLWPELTPDGPRKGYSSRFVKFFSFFNREFVTKSSKKSFHSLRHNFVEVIRNNAPEAIACQLIGMSPKTVTLGRYGRSLEQPEAMLEYLCKLDYGFDIFALTGIEPLSECEVAEQVEHFFDRPF